MPLATSPARIDAPAVAPAKGGLLAVATVHTEWEPHYGFGLQYFSFLCGTGGVVPGPCGDVAGIEFDVTKTAGGGQIGYGYPFAIYAGVECDLFGRPYDQQARDRLVGSEEYLVGKAFYELTLLGDQPFPAVQLANALPDSADIYDLVDVIGELEEHAGETYAGTPVLHMNRRTAALAIASGYVLPDPLSGVLVTGQGTPVANSPGYPDDLIFITGQVHLWRSPVSTYAADTPLKNTAMALAERLYVASTECVLAYAGAEPVAAAAGQES